ncbi:VOC family protein [Phytomonospora sp. NPDC050363]|uniref:VOC family protein n=1 Tax=Phytomonospora sp. NPDC050363 TaxID=3155642 RepID=UPI0033FDA983
MVTISPIIGYRDQRAALKWLAEAFGFQELEVHEAEGEIVHAEMSYGDGVIMLGREHKETSGVYVVVEDADAHHARAVAAGARVTRELSDQDYGSRDYAALDLEGNEWYFGTYRPKI